VLFENRRDRGIHYNSVTIRDIESELCQRDFELLRVY
jgi:hypothetical protein